MLWQGKVECNTGIRLDSPHLAAISRSARGVTAQPPEQVVQMVRHDDTWYTIRGTRRAATHEKDSMPEATTIQSQHDADAALEKARETNRSVLIYFSAAPA
jgi:hypothetical protein